MSASHGRLYQSPLNLDLLHGLGSLIHVKAGAIPGMLFHVIVNFAEPHMDRYQNTRKTAKKFPVF